MTCTEGNLLQGPPLAAINDEARADMPVYTFILRSDDERPLRVMVDLPDGASAYAEAVRACADMARDASDQPTDTHTSEVRVVNGDGEVLCTVVFSASRWIP